MSLIGINKKSYDEIEVGAKEYFAKTVTEADIMLFAGLSGDYAAHHVNKDFASTTMFGGRIAHGMLTSGLICPVLTKLCGANSTTLWQEIKFKSAVKLNDTITVCGEVTEKLEDGKIKLLVECFNQEDTLVVTSTFIIRFFE